MNPEHTQWFTEARFGLFIHWGIYSVPAQGEWMFNSTDSTWPEYEKYAAVFNPVNFRPDKWARLAKNAGMKYVVFTTKHHDGFCMYDSHYTDFKITNTPYGKDITAELAGAFRAEGIRIGFYHSLVDWRHPHFIPDMEHPDGKHGKTDFPERKREIYQEYLFRQLEQLMSCYGKIDLLFFDYTSRYKSSEEWNPARLMEMIRRLQPEILVNDRLSFNKKSWTGDYLTPEICVPNQPLRMNGKLVPWETCMTMNDHWGYDASDRRFKTASSLATALTQIVAENGNLLLNIGPDSLGEIPDGSIRILQQLADWYALNGESVYKAGIASYAPPQGCHYTAKDPKTIYLHIPYAPAGDIILPELLGKINKITMLQDGSDITQVIWWGEELLNSDELRIRLPVKDISYPAVLKILLK